MVLFRKMGEPKVMGFEASIFDGIVDGTVTVVGRLARDKYSDVDVADQIRLRRDTYADKIIADSDVTDVIVDVLSLKPYATFNEMIEAEGTVSVVPGAATSEEALTVYRQFYTEEDEKQYGVIALRLAIVDD